MWNLFPGMGNTPLKIIWLTSVLLKVELELIHVFIMINISTHIKEVCHWF